MTWRVGFFRAWIVISIAWVLAVAVVYFSSVKDGPWNAYQSQAVEMMNAYAIETPSGRHLEVMATDEETAVRGAKELEESQQPATDEELERFTFMMLPDGKLIEFPKKTPREVMQQAVQKYYAQLDSSASARSRKWAAAIGFIPPAGLFILGSAIGWVASGFRANGEKGLL